MARPLRIAYPGAFYHVINRGLERREIYRDQKDYEAFLLLCREIYRRFHVILHAYCLMPNHYHLMVETPEGNLSRAMRHPDGVYTQGVNRRKQRRVGPLFQGRYKAHLIDREAYSLQVSRYIHLNPVKAKMVKWPEDYGYSSFQYYMKAGKKRPEFLQTDWLLGQFHKKYGKARSGFHQFTMNGLKDSWSPEEGLKAGMILGGEDFFEKIWSDYVEDKEDREIPDLRKNRKLSGEEEVQACLKNVCHEPGVRDRLLVWALKRYTPLKLHEIAKKIQKPISYSAVSQICRRVERARSGDKALHEIVSRVEAEMSNVKT